MSSAVFHNGHNCLRRMLQPARSRGIGQRSKLLVTPRGLKPAARVEDIVVGLTKHGTMNLVLGGLHGGLSA